MIAPVVFTHIWVVEVIAPVVFTHIWVVEFIALICYLYLFTYICYQHDFHITWCSSCLIVTQLVSLVYFSEVHVTKILVFCVVFCRQWFLFLSFFFLVIEFSALLWNVDSDYPFDIFKHFFLKTYLLREIFNCTVCNSVSVFWFALFTFVWILIESRKMLHNCST